MGVAFFVGTYIYEVQSWVRGVIVMDKTAFFTMPSGLYVVSAAADGCVPAALSTQRCR